MKEIKKIKVNSVYGKAVDVNSMYPYQMTDSVRKAENVKDKLIEMVDKYLEPFKYNNCYVCDLSENYSCIILLKTELKTESLQKENYGMVRQSRIPFLEFWVYNSECGLMVRCSKLLVTPSITSDIDEELFEIKEQIKMGVFIKNKEEKKKCEESLKYLDPCKHCYMEDEEKDEIIQDCLNLLHTVRTDMTKTEYDRLVEICKRVKGMYEEEEN